MCAGRCLCGCREGAANVGGGGGSLAAGRGGRARLAAARVVLRGARAWKQEAAAPEAPPARAPCPRPVERLLARRGGSARRRPGAGERAEQRTAPRPPHAPGSRRSAPDSSGPAAARAFQWAARTCSTRACRSVRPRARISGRGGGAGRGRGGGRGGRGPRLCVRVRVRAGARAPALVGGAGGAGPRERRARARAAACACAAAPPARAGDTKGCGDLGTPAAGTSHSVRKPRRPVRPAGRAGRVTVGGALQGGRARR